jgi:DNA-binding transcriptional regulator YiaG
VSKKLSFRAALERLGEIPAGDPGRSDFQAVSVVLEADRLPQPVEVARTLRAHGVSLRTAHEAINRLAERGFVALAVRNGDEERLASDLSVLGVTATPIRTPQVDPRSVREKLGLSQVEFSTLFGLELDTVQNWEQGRNKPDRVTRTFLKIVETYPQMVRAILTGRSSPTPTPGLRSSTRPRPNSS